uniref:Uncharacterized protein n=1 Tax=Bracon brevicornis TaxID=1563983 RepID=A0A6V7KHK7_9HYME
MGECALRLLPDFRPCGHKMRQRVIRIIELIEHLALPGFCHLARQIARAFHATRRADQHQLCTVGAHRQLPLTAHVLRHQQPQAIPFHRGNHRQHNTSVATDGFNQPIARGYFSAPFSLLHHKTDRTIFYRASRIIAFQLKPDLTAGILCQPLQLDEWRIANGVIQRTQRVSPTDST